MLPPIAKLTDVHEAPDRWLYSYAVVAHRGGCSSKTALLDLPMHFHESYQALHDWHMVVLMRLTDDRDPEVVPEAEYETLWENYKEEFRATWGSEDERRRSALREYELIRQGAEESAEAFIRRFQLAVMQVTLLDNTSRGSASDWREAVLKKFMRSLRAPLADAIAGTITSIRLTRKSAPPSVDDAYAARLRWQPLTSPGWSRRVSR